MKAFKLVYDAKLNRLKSLQFDVKNERDFSSDPDTNLSDSVNSHNCNPDTFLYSLACFNNELAIGSLEIRKCNRCNKYFMLADDEKDWFLQKDMCLPKRCKLCRGKKQIAV